MVDWAVRNRLLVVLGLIAALIGSVFSLQKLNVDAFPEVTNVDVDVQTEAPGTCGRGSRTTDHLIPSRP